jgi:hypothetical protein
MAPKFDGRKSVIVKGMQNEFKSIFNNNQPILRVDYKEIYTINQGIKTIGTSVKTEISHTYAFDFL